jgi:hypothetical protein
MCIIIYSPDGVIPKKHLHASLDNNPDGWGIMWPQDGKLEILQGLKKSEFFYNWKWVRSIKAPKVFHARIGTHGDDSFDNCHPFVVPNHGELAMAHNGIISQCADATSAKSDTKLFVENLLAKMPPGFYLNSAIQELLSDYVNHSKLVFMDGAGQVAIINSHHGKWVGEMWYSNHSYTHWRNNGTYYYSAPKSKPEMGFAPTGSNLVKAPEYSLLPDRVADSAGGLSSQLPEHYRNIGASMGLVCVNK